LSANPIPGSWKSLKRAFFLEPPEVVAPQLLGVILAHRTPAGPLAGRIVEVEAYLGPHITATPDPAAHSFRGPSPRNAVMFGPPGHAYVYFIYGMYFCVNVTCEPEGRAGAVLIRALEPLTGRDQMAANRNLPVTTSDASLTAGPGRLCQALAITRPAHNGLDFLATDSPLRLFEDNFPVTPHEVTPRIGIRHAAELPLRFSFTAHPCVSRNQSRQKPS
jgi:DNA-3-methyladenine glycosylase